MLKKIKKLFDANFTDNKNEHKKTNAQKRLQELKETHDVEIKVNEVDVENYIEEITKDIKNTKIEKGDKMAERYEWYEKNGVKIYGRIPEDETTIENIGGEKKGEKIGGVTKTTTTTKSNWWDNWRSSYQTAKRPTKIVDNKTFNVVFFKQNILNKIMNKCLPKAKECEFQFHYRALQLKIINPENNIRIVFTIPTIFFNFEQEVSGAAIDYDLKKVSEISEQLKPVSQQMAKVFVSQLKPIIEYFKQKGFEVKFVEEEVGSIHRHPGRFGFSSTDLDDNPLSPGVIYRNKKAVDLIQTDSVLYCGTDAELYTTETRIFNIKPVDEVDEDKGVEGTVATAPTLCYILQDQNNSNIDPFATFFDEPVQESETKWLIHSYKDAKEYKKIKELFEEFIKIYTPADAVNPDNIKQKTYYGSYYYSSGYSYYSYDRYSYKGGRSVKKNIADAKEEIAMELKFFEPVNHQDIEFAKEYLKDPETVANLKDIYEYYKNKKDKLVIDFKGGAQVRMNSREGQLFYKGKTIWSWKWSEADDFISYDDLYKGI